MIPPAIPAPSGPNAARANFYTEAAAAFEVMALYHSLTKAEQETFRSMLSGFVAAVTEREMKQQQKGK